MTFFVGLLVMLLSLNGPLHDLSDYYCSMHMVQHLMLTQVMRPAHPRPAVVAGRRDRRETGHGEGARFWESLIGGLFIAA